MKIEWLVIDVTAIGFLGKAERAISGGILAGRIFGKFRIYLWSGTPFVM